MPKWMPASLRGQILCCLLIPLILMVISNAYFAYDAASDLAEQTYDRHLQTSILTLANETSVISGRPVMRQGSHFPNSLDLPNDEQRYYRINGSGGDYLAGMPDFPTITQSDPATQDNPDNIRMAYAEYKGQTLRVASLDFVAPDGGAGDTFEIKLAETLDGRTNLSWQIFWYSLLHQSVLIVAAAILVWISIRLVLRPLQNLSRDLGQRSANNLSHFQVHSVQLEIQPLVLAINAYMVRLSQMINTRQRFIADASHQLRTPLAVLKTQAELAMRERDIGVIHGLLAHIRRTTDSTVELANDLLNLSRAGHVIAEQDMQLTDLREILRSLALMHSGSAIRKRIDLSLDTGHRTGDDFNLIGHPLLMREMLNNLIDNALRYTPSGGQVRLRLRTAEQHLQIDVADSGPGIPLTERAKVFSPFYRNSNGLTVNPEGSGLGLSIVNDIVQAHRGHISLSEAWLTTRNCGLLIRIVLPRDGNKDELSEPAW